MNKPSTPEMMNDLHALVCRTLTARLQSDDCSPAYIAAAVKFLKDSDITAAMLPGSPLKNLFDSLPFAAQGIEHQQ